MTVTQAMYLVGGFKAGKTILWHAAGVLSSSQVFRG
jgi:hypothetical protein